MLGEACGSIALEGRSDRSVQAIDIGQKEDPKEESSFVPFCQAGRDRLDALDTWRFGVFHDLLRL